MVCLVIELTISFVQRRKKTRLFLPTQTPTYPFHEKSVNSDFGKKVFCNFSDLYFFGGDLSLNTCLVFSETFCLVIAILYFDLKNSGCCQTILFTRFSASSLYCSNLICSKSTFVSPLGSNKSCRRKWITSNELFLSITNRTKFLSPSKKQKKVTGLLAVHHQQHPFYLIS